MDNNKITMYQTTAIKLASAIELSTTLNEALGHIEDLRNYIQKFEETNNMEDLTTAIICAKNIPFSQLRDLRNASNELATLILLREE